jgi:hypothetical protein
MVYSSVVISDLNVKDIAVAEAKANAPLVVDPDGMLSGAVALQRFQPVRRWQPQVCKSRCGMQLPKPHQGALENVLRQSPTFAGSEELRSLGIGKRPDHAGYINILFIMSTELAALAALRGGNPARFVARANGQP